MQEGKLGPEKAQQYSTEEHRTEKKIKNNIVQKKLKKSLTFMLTEAPRLRRVEAVVVLPCLAARCRGVLPPRSICKSLSLISFISSLSLISLLSLRSLLSSSGSRHLKVRKVK